MIHEHRPDNVDNDQNNVVKRRLSTVKHDQNDWYTLKWTYTREQDILARGKISRTSGQMRHILTKRARIDFSQWQSGPLKYLPVYSIGVWCSVVQCGAVWCSVVQCGAVCCSVLQCVAMCSHWQSRPQKHSPVYGVAVCCIVLQCVTACCSVLQCVAACCSVLRCAHIGKVGLTSIFQCMAWQYVALCCSVLQYVAVCCSVSQYAAVCCSVSSVLQCAHVGRVGLEMFGGIWRCSMLHCVAVCYGMLQCVSGCRSVLTLAK